MRIAILDALTTDQGLPATWDSIRALGEVSVHERSSLEEVVTRGAGCQALLTNKAQLQAAAIAALPDLRYIGVMATGTNIVDLKACAERGIVVSNVPGYSTASVAQLVFAHLFDLVNDVAGHSRRVLGGDWVRSPDFAFFTRPLHELAGKRIVILGAGAIGKAVAAIAEAFGMLVTFAQVPGSSSTDRMPLNDAIASADVISLHCPLTDATKHLVNRDFLARCKKGVILINTGRGPLIDEAAVADALVAGALGGAGLDVLSSEPPRADNPLLAPAVVASGRLVITPHIAWGTVEARQRLVAEVTANLAAFIAGNPRNRVA